MERNRLGMEVAKVGEKMGRNFRCGIGIMLSILAPWGYDDPT